MNNNINIFENTEFKALANRLFANNPEMVESDAFIELVSFVHNHGLENGSPYLKIQNEINQFCDKLHAQSV